MGIPGLMTYIAQHSDIYLQNYSLHDTFLVIDGNSIASQLYNYEAKCNYCFGGDYDRYAYCVSNFFNDLLKCNIIPLIIIDGGLEEKKLSTSYRRTKEKINAANNVTLCKQKRNQLFPLLLKEVFKNVAHQKGIKCTQSLFEADEDLASVAKILNCPVLSFDSDFYIFDVMYIPYNTLDYGVSKNPSGTGYVKNCKIYKIDYFLQRFPGMNKNVIPLAATLLGNDYINKSSFKDFFCTLKLSKTSKRRFNEQQRRIEATFRWLQKQTLDSAIAKVLNKLDPKKREKILEVMEFIINGYLICSPKMLNPLGFSSDYINNLMQNISNKPYKFQQDINNLKVIEEPKEDYESDLSCNESDDSPSEELDVIKPENENNLCNITPLWFIQEFKAGNFPSYFIDMITRQLYICPVQIEDFAQPTCINISLKIIHRIFKLLNTGTTNCNILEYITRGKLTNISTFKLQCEDSIFSCQVPSLTQLPSLPLIIRKKIIDETLGVIDELLNQFPPEWRLYIATVKYWIDQAELPFKTNCHVYSLLFAMLFHIIDKKAGICRSQIHFERKYGECVNKILQKRNQETLISPPLQNMPIQNALDSVNFEDCLLAIPFFLSNFSINQGLMMNPKKFHLSVVHAFSLFQNCLRHSMHLNALLGYPYQNVNVADFLNGTLLYNLCTNFKNRTDIDSYINGILRNSPTLLQLFISIVTSVKAMFLTAFENKANTKKRKKHRSKQNKNLPVPDDEFDVEEDFHNIPYCDSNNRYAALNNSNF